MLNIIITGANQGIGYYFTEQALKNGNKVAVLDLEVPATAVPLVEAAKLTVAKLRTSMRVRINATSFFMKENAPFRMDSWNVTLILLLE